MKAFYHDFLSTYGSTLIRVSPYVCFYLTGFVYMSVCMSVCVSLKMLTYNLYRTVSWLS